MILCDYFDAWVSNFVISGHVLGPFVCLQHAREWSAFCPSTPAPSHAGALSHTHVVCPANTVFTAENTNNEHESPKGNNTVQYRKVSS